MSMAALKEATATAGLSDSDVSQYGSRTKKSTYIEALNTLASSPSTPPTPPSNSISSAPPPPTSSTKPVKPVKSIPKLTPETGLIEASHIESSSLLDYLQLLISFRGPLTVAEYINHALLHPEFGYYTQDQSKGGAVFGKDHDFTTAPEISQMFAELLGVWVVHTAMDLGLQKFHLVEIGPGRGTLMEDVVRTISQFSQVANNLETIHLVEKSASLRTLQKEKVQWPNVEWHDTFSDIPGDVPCIVLAQELFDALPVHQFELTEHGWCERLVDVIEEDVFDDIDESGKEVEENVHGAKENNLNRPVSGEPVPSPPTTVVGDEQEGEHDEQEQLRFVLSSAPTNASRVYVRMFDPIPILPHAEAPLANEATATDPTDPTASDDDNTPPSSDAPIDKDAIGSRLEVCPAGCALSQDIALRISAHGGAALLVDYGKDRASGDSLRGIRNHQFVSPLQSPGRVDLSVDVDFASLKAAALALKIDGLQVYGTVGQGEFLKKLGIETRLHALLQTDITEEQAEALYLAYHRLTDPDEMGTVYRAMAMVKMPSSGDQEDEVTAPTPAGF